MLAGYVVGNAMMIDEWKAYRVGPDAVLDQVNVQDIEILELLQEGRKTAKAGKGQYAVYCDYLCKYLSQRVREKVEQALGGEWVFSAGSGLSEFCIVRCQLCHSLAGPGGITPNI